MIQTLKEKNILEKDKDYEVESIEDKDSPLMTTYKVRVKNKKEVVGVYVLHMDSCNIKDGTTHEIIYEDPLLSYSEEEVDENSALEKLMKVLKAYHELDLPIENYKFEVKAVSIEDEAPGTGYEITLRDKNEGGEVSAALERYFVAQNGTQIQKYDVIEDAYVRIYGTRMWNPNDELELSVQEKKIKEVLNAYLNENRAEGSEKMDDTPLFDMDYLYYPQINALRERIPGKYTSCNIFDGEGETEKERGFIVSLSDYAFFEMIGAHVVRAKDGKLVAPGDFYNEEDALSLAQALLIQEKKHTLEEVHFKMLKKETEGKWQVSVLDKASGKKKSGYVFDFWNRMIYREDEGKMTLLMDDSQVMKYPEVHITEENVLAHLGKVLNQLGVMSPAEYEGLKKEISYDEGAEVADGRSGYLVLLYDGMDIQDEYFVAESGNAVLKYFGADDSFDYIYGRWSPLG